MHLVPGYFAVPGVEVAYVAATTAPSDAADLSATTGGLSLSEEMLGRLDERQVESIIESYNALKLYLMLTGFSFSSRE